MNSYSVIGTGAIGGYYGGRLAESGRTVSFLARGDYEYLAANGLSVASKAGDFRIFPIDAHNRASDLPERDVVIVSLKTTSNATLRELLAPAVRPGTVVLVMQNGLGMEEEVASWFPEALVVAGMCFICSQKTGPGRVSHMDYGSLTIAAHGPDTARTREVLSSIKADFEESKVSVTVSPSLGEARWRKLLWNIPYNGTSVILDADTKEIMDTPSSRRMVRRLMEEVVRGAAACGYAIEQEAVDRMLEFTDRMTPYKPSMKIDRDSARPMEVEYMYLRPLKAARDKGVELPAISTVADQLLFLESRPYARSRKV